eukprot:scaffold9570_cov151-Skeletonema_menzelii.AAC.3
MPSNPRINGLYETPNVLSAEEADKLSNAIDNQHYGEWCPEGFDRRNRVQRYSGSDMEDHFGWVFDKINGAVEASLRRPLELVITEHTPSSSTTATMPVLRRSADTCQQCNLFT